MTATATKWEVVIWETPNRSFYQTFETKAEAYQYANRYLEAHAIEIYGPNGEYDAC